MKMNLASLLRMFRYEKKNKKSQEQLKYKPSGLCKKVLGVID